MGGRRRNSEEDEAPFKNNEKGTRMVVGLSNKDLLQVDGDMLSCCFSLRGEWYRRGR